MQICDQTPLHLSRKLEFYNTDSQKKGGSDEWYGYSELMKDMRVVDLALQ